ncbi:UNVERIFIED_CONTAM: copper amine oxidase-like protein [Acetivibrio alkalicellulosi]
MKRIVAIFVFLVVLAVPFCLDQNNKGVQASSDGISVRLNQSKLNFDVNPYIKNGRTMVPFRMIFEAMKLEVSWNGSNRTVIASNDTTEIKIAIGQNHAFVNGFRIELDVAAEIVNGRTFVPLRFVAENSGAEVIWYGDTRTVDITYVFEKFRLKDKARFRDLEFSIDGVEVTNEGRVVTINGIINQPDKVMVIEVYNRSKRIASGFTNMAGKEGDKYIFESIIFASLDFQPKYIVVKTFNEDKKLVKIAEYIL